MFCSARLLRYSHSYSRALPGPFSHKSTPRAQESVRINNYRGTARNEPLGPRRGDAAYRSVARADHPSEAPPAHTSEGHVTHPSEERAAHPSALGQPLNCRFEHADCRCECFRAFPSRVRSI
ncbi:uncharacterized protein SCHCODRAFT_02045960 [Schizophyllum commune H4-8]|uniref:uncharacterized protein n=1 Tax=Schizophyllum commune (strain H4-8 / FGSC 9210) TaxID=578458 RepID=UPI00215FDA9E|nr:uncharacterized protein SCHCODRAFT_02045960 [Schizophyllum commune H4-8]KAI5888115.1 hypothetical protein SCHCODRAFT_02045960 [Schizophyllum commune H4-8]